MRMSKLALSLSAAAAALTAHVPAFAHGTDGHDNANGHGAHAHVMQDAATGEGAADDTPTMNFGSWGIDPSEIDTTIDPGDDFYAYMNRKWMQANTIPSDRSRFGSFDLLAVQAEKDLRTIVTDMAAQGGSLDTPEGRVAAAYAAYLDTDTINAKGLAPARPYLDAIYGAGDLAGLMRLFGTPGYPAPLGLGVTTDSKNPDQYIPILAVGGQGLPDRDYYLKDTEKNLEIRAKYREYLTFLASQLDYADPGATADAVYALERRFAMADWDNAMSRNRNLTYNRLSRDELMALAGDAPLAAMLDASGIDTDQFWVYHVTPTAEEIAQYGLTVADLAKLGGGVEQQLEILSETDMATLQAWAALHLIDNRSSVLPEAIDNASFEFYGKTLQGTPEQQARWKRALSATEGMMGETLGKEFVSRHFPPENKASMDQLVANLRKAMAVNLEDLDWMGAETRQEAVAKLNAFTPKIGYPDEFETYDGMDIVKGDAFANAMASDRWHWNDMVSKLGQPVDRGEWHMTPQTVNAYYNPTMNEIVFPAAILQPPFFNAGADDAVNYGAIGAVIGHEMGHGFDDQGAKSDGEGVLRNWWTEKDLANFEALTSSLTEQYNAFCPFDDGETCVNGSLTLGENIGDLGGLSLAYRAYKMSLGGKDAPVIDGLTGDQRFFLAWAQVWRTLMREEAARTRMATDPHSPNQYRVNGIVRNFDEWYDAFGVTAEDDLYLPPEERIRIW